MEDNNYFDDDYNSNNLNNNKKDDSKLSIIIILAILCLVVVFGLSAFNVIPGPFSSVSSSDIAFAEKTVKVKRNSGIQLSLKGNNSNVKYKSSDTKIATVNEFTGYVTGIKNGKATITMYDGDKAIDSCTVEVYTPSSSVDITSLKLSETNITLYIGNTKQLKVTISPSNATNKKIIWSTSNKNVATINSNGVVAAKSEGTATIKVRTESGVNATCNVTVKKKSSTTPTPTPTPTPTTTQYTLTYNANGGSVSPTSKKLNKGAAYGSLPTPTRSGYTFNGWYTQASGGSKVSSSTIINANTTIYAQWTKNSTPAPTPTTQTNDKIHFIKQASSNKTDKYLNNGDAILLESNGHFAMIDTGLNNATDNKYVLNYLKSVGVTKLDFILISHFHRDHVGGLLYLLKNIPISKIYMKTYLGKDEEASKYKSLYTNIKNTAKNKGVPITYIDKSFKDGEGFTFQDMKIRLYNTKQNNKATIHYGDEETTSVINENSNTVLQLINVNGYKILLTGDLYDEKSNLSLITSLSKKSDFKNLDLLKMPHHGSTRSAFGGEKQGSTNKEAFKRFNPKYVVVTNSSCAICKSIGATKNIYYSRAHKGTIFTFGSTISIDYK